MRRTRMVRIEAEGRDKGKQFLLREMPSAQAEAWGSRFLLALARSGVQIPPNIMELGLAGVAYVGVTALGGLQWGEARDLLEEMMACVSVVPEPKRPDFTRPLIDGGGDGDDIEEIATRVYLRNELVDLHTGFSIAAHVSSLRFSQTQAAPKSGGENTATSPVQSPQS